MLSFFLARLERYQVRWTDMPMTGISSLEDLLRTIERGVTQGYQSASLDGCGLSLALVDGEVWQGAQAAGSGGPPFPRPGSIAAETYASDFAHEVAEVVAVQRFMRQHHLVWRPTRSDGQHGREDVPIRLARARARWNSVSGIAEALDRYEERAR